MRHWSCQPRQLPESKTYQKERRPEVQHGIEAVAERDELKRNLSRDHLKLDGPKWRAPNLSQLLSQLLLPARHPPFDNFTFRVFHLWRATTAAKPHGLLHFSDLRLIHPGRSS